jgi:hypothetical protein
MDVEVKKAWCYARFSKVPRYFRKFREIFRSSARFSEVPRDSRKFREIFGSSTRFSKGPLYYRKFCEIFGSSARFSAPFQTDPGAHPYSCSMGTGSLSWGLKHTQVCNDVKPFTQYNEAFEISPKSVLCEHHWLIRRRPNDGVILPTLNITILKPPCSLPYDPLL